MRWAGALSLMTVRRSIRLPPRRRRTITGFPVWYWESRIACHFKREKEIEPVTIITRKHLARRTFLGGMGAALALPMLDSMAPAFAAPGVKAPTRLLFTYIP